MVENYEEAGHGLKGPHFDLAGTQDLPANFEPLRLMLQSQETQPEQIVLEVARPAVLVGRHTCADVRLAYPEVSRRHCRLAFQEGFWHIIDLNSLNGLYVNGERVHEAVLQNGDIIRVGSVTMWVQPGAEEADRPLKGILRSIADNLH
jgi:pSer/pThr/pTyr-binding forkhead associated (FHA) protein